jgi:valyl-tRNA synthetase
LVNLLSAMHDALDTNLTWRQGAEQAVEFFTTQFCDVYLEFAKPVLFDESSSANHKAQVRAVLLVCLETFLRAFHPICPFITEELWQRLPASIRSSDSMSIMTSTYPVSSHFPGLDASHAAKLADEGFEHVLATLSTFRSTLDQHKGRHSNGVEPELIVIVCPTGNMHELFSSVAKQLAFIMRVPLHQLKIVLPTHAGQQAEVWHFVAHVMSGLHELISTLQFYFLELICGYTYIFYSGHGISGRCLTNSIQPPG